MAEPVYLDNAATSFPKPKCVIEAVHKYLKLYCGNPGRSSHALAVKSSEAVYNTRELIAELIGAPDPRNIIFTTSATHGLNLLVKGLIKGKCNVIISNKEHNSVIRPLYKAITEHGGSITVIENTDDLLTSVESVIKEDTEAVFLNLTSNVTGSAIDTEAIRTIKKKYGLRIVLDASQAIGHRTINVNEIDCDAIAAPGHKALFGLQGSGFVYLKNDFLADTLIEGGNGYETFNQGMGDVLPEKYEAGTLPTPSIVGLGEGIRFIKSVGLENIESETKKLTDETEYVLSSLKNLKIIGAENGIISFNYKDYPSGFISSLLDKHNIATRSGFHCAPLIHRFLNTAQTGAVRASLSYFNKKSDIDRLYKVLKNETKVL